MDSIEEQWTLTSPPDIVSDSWTDINSAKAVKVWILDRGKSWKPSISSNKTRLQLHLPLLDLSITKP